MTNFKTQFPEIFNDIRATLINEAEAFSEDSDPNSGYPKFEELNKPITTAEDMATVKRLNRNKASCLSDNLFKRLCMLLNLY